MQPSIFTSSIRSFLIGMFATLGVGIGLIGIFAFFASAMEVSEGKMDTETYYEPKIAANSQNVRKKLPNSSPVILKIDISGVIGTEKLCMAGLRQLLIESREGSLKDNRVKAVLVKISTPGGTAVDSDGIYRALLAYKNQYKTPIYAYVDGGCLSGGMYIAAACDKIYATPVSIIGSIGTVSGPFFNVAQTLEKIGTEAKTLTQGEGKDPLNPFRPWKEGEAKEIEDVMHALYKHFVAVVANARPKLSAPKIENDLGARFFPTQEALELGLIDGQLSSEAEALDLLAKEAELDPENTQVVEMEQKLWFTNLFRNSSDLLRGKVTHQIELSPKIIGGPLEHFMFL